MDYWPLSLLFCSQESQNTLPVMFISALLFINAQACLLRGVCLCMNVSMRIHYALCRLSDRSLCEWLWSAMVDDEHVSCKDAALPPLKMAVHLWSCCRNIFQMVMRPVKVLCHCVNPLKRNGKVWPCKGISLQIASSWVLPLWWCFILSFG